MGILSLAVVLAAGYGAHPSQVPAGPCYALVPARNLTADAQAPEAVLGPLRRELERRGARFVDPAEVEELLQARRIRYTDSLSRADLGALGEHTGAQFALVTTILEFTPGTLPRVALTLRALSTATGARVLSQVVSLRGEDQEGLLGLGRVEAIEPLVEQALGSVLEAFDEQGRPALRAPRRRSARPAPAAGDTGFVRDDFDPAALERVALLPLQNRSGDPDAPLRFGEFLGDAWFRGRGVEVCELAEVRAALRAQKVRSMQFVDLARLAEIGRAIGVRYFVQGVVERYGDEALVRDKRYPELEATVQLIDAERGTIVAAASVRRRGSDYETLLGLGVVNDPTELAIRAAREVVAALGG